MSAVDLRPVVLLAFSNTKPENPRYLRNLGEEERRLEEAFKAPGLEHRIKVVILPFATSGQVFDAFQDHRDRVVAFHFAGHADGYRLFLEEAAGEKRAIYPAGFAAFLGSQSNLKLVFLNACSTRPHVQGLLDNGIEVVVATSKAVVDGVASDFAGRFYRALAGSATVNRAYHEASALAPAVEGEDPGRLVNPAERMEVSDFVREFHLSEDGLPWRLYTRKGAEAAADWSLCDAEDDPGAGLPGLPSRYYESLGDSPFRYLNWFAEADAAVFFGRGEEIRRLYDRVVNPGEAPIILVCGPTGVGKSSLLAAGLAPQLVRHEVRYARRDPKKGLLGSLLAALPAGGEGLPLGAAWKAVERPGRPLVMILDQVEEAFTTAGPDSERELGEFLEALRSTFSPRAGLPAGKLLLGFRKEWYAEISRLLSQAQLRSATDLLQPISRRGIIEVVYGPARPGPLLEKFGLTVEDGLAETIADMLISDARSTIAPTLQVLLSKMWEKARDRDLVHPHFDRALYDTLKDQGLLGHFLDEQLDAFKKRWPEAVTSGLTLDLLEYHTTPRGTSKEHTLDEIRAHYAQTPETAERLVRELADLYLLGDPAERGAKFSSSFRLAHDALGPLVLERFNASDLPGQKARRVLQGRAGEWADARKKGTALDERDLALVERGLSGMRAVAPKSDEERLLSASRRKYVRRYGLGMTLLFFAPLVTEIASGSDMTQKSVDAIGLAFGVPLFLAGTWVMARRLRVSPWERRGVGLAVAGLMLCLFYLVHLGVSSPIGGDVSPYVPVSVVAGFALPALGFSLVSYRSDRSARKTLAGLAAVCALAVPCLALGYRDVRLRARLDDGLKAVSFALGRESGFVSKFYIQNMKLTVHLHNFNYFPDKEEVLRRVRAAVPAGLPQDIHTSGFNRAPVVSLTGDSGFAYAVKGGVADLNALVAVALAGAVRDEVRCTGKAPSVAVLPVYGEARERTADSEALRAVVLEELSKPGSGAGPVYQGEQLAAALKAAGVDLPEGPSPTFEVVSQMLYYLQVHCCVMVRENLQSIGVYLITYDTRVVMLGTLSKTPGAYGPFPVAPMTDGVPAPGIVPPAAAPAPPAGLLEPDAAPAAPPAPR